MNIEQIKFGPSGNSQSFYDEGYRSSIDMPKWLHNMGLNAYEYSCTRGVNIKEETARAIGKEACRWGIMLSVHAPYYINLATIDEEKRLKNKKYILDTLKAAEWLGATRVVFHPGSCAKIDREQAFHMAELLFKEIINDSMYFFDKGIKLCPETMGKINQLGTLDEVLYLCSLSDAVLPTVDFGHIHALGRGIINTIDDYACILDRIQSKLSGDRSKNFHVHFSRIEYTQGGEKKHWTLDDVKYGPDFEPLAELLVKRDMKPTIICESRNRMAEDALKLKTIYDEKLYLFN